jgi:hypothetical protein
MEHLPGLLTIFMWREFRFRKLSTISSNREVIMRFVNRDEPKSRYKDFDTLKVGTIFRDYYLKRYIKTGLNGSGQNNAYSFDEEKSAILPNGYSCIPLKDVEIHYSEDK